MYPACNHQFSGPLAPSENEAFLESNFARVVTEKEAETDVEMKTSPDDAPPLPPRPRTSPIEWHPDVNVPPYEPQEPAPITDVAEVVDLSKMQENVSAVMRELRSPEVEELENLGSQVLELDKRLGTAIGEWEEKIKEIKSQMFADECLLTELSWKSADLNRLERNTQKERKKQQRLGKRGKITHKYQTRAQTFDERNVLLESATMSVKTRIETLEKQMKEAREEMEKVQGKVADADTLKNYIEEIAASVNSQHQNQLQINRLALPQNGKEPGTPVATELDAQIKENTQNIGLLWVRFQQLCVYVMAVLYNVTVVPPPPPPPYASDYPYPQDQPAQPYQWKTTFAF